MSHSLKNSSKIVDVVIENTPSEEEIYSFVLPENLIPKVKVGMRVFIPFGRGNKLKKGLVVSIRDGEGEGLKEVLGIVNPFRIIDEEGIKVLLDINREYFIPTFKFIKNLLPVGKGRKGEEFIKIVYKDWEVKLSKREKRKREILSFIEENGGEVPLSTLKKYFSLSIINELIKNGIVTKEFYLSEERKIKIKERAEEIKSIKAKDRLDMGDDRILLIKGYTYKERWNLYKDSITDFIKRKKRIKLIFPERKDAEDFFKFLPKGVRNFGEVFTGKTSKRERYKIYRRIDNKEISFIVGTQISLFLPLKEDRIIVDRAEYFSLLEELIPKEFEIISLRYAEIGKKEIVFGCFIPSLPLYYLSKKFGWKVISKDLKLGRVKIISNPHGLLFTQSIERIVRKNKNKKIFIFLPRKGYFTFLYCGDCGYVEKCPRCKVPLTYFKERGKLVCKICGYEEKPFDTCPVCGGISMRFASPGTERVKDILLSRFKERNIFELDESIVGKSKRLRKRVEKEFIKEGDILIGTQMIFPLLRSVKNFLFIFLDVDFILNFPEYDSSEKLFYTIMKVLEEARVMDGEVIIQTRIPRSKIFSSIKGNKLEEFIRYEFFKRKEAGYPPYVKYVKLKNINEENIREIEKIANEDDTLYRNGGELILKTKNILKFEKVFDKIKGKARIEIKEF